MFKKENNINIVKCIFKNKSKYYKYNDYLLSETFLYLVSMQNEKRVVEEQNIFESNKKEYFNRKHEYDVMRSYNQNIVNLYYNGQIMLNNKLYRLSNFYIKYNSKKDDYDLHLMCVDSNYTDILTKSLDNYEYDGVIKFIDSKVFIDLIKNKNVQVDYEKNIVYVNDERIISHLLDNWDGTLHELTSTTDAIKNRPILKRYIKDEYAKGEKKMKTIRDFDLKNKKVLIRVDFNVPIKNGIIQDDNRIKESLETINYAINKNAKVILLSHLGRIKSEEDKINNTLLPVSERLSELLQKKVIFIDETHGNKLEDAINNMQIGDVLLMENTRFEDLEGKKESGNDVELGKYWASLGDIFINDAFGTCHRAHASNVGIAGNLPSGIGFLVEKELNNMLPVIKNPIHPFTVILGGSKVSDKIGVIENLINQCDYLLIGGGMAYTFLKAKGDEIGKSLFDEESLDYCKNLLQKTNKIILPVDHVVSKSIDSSECFVTSQIKDDEIGLDIGPKTIELFTKYIALSKTIVWNGPMGMFENPLYQNGTIGICKAFNKEQNVIVGGGDSASAVINLGYKDRVSHISTGGGASLELLEGKKLPGISIIGE